MMNVTQVCAYVRISRRTFFACLASGSGPVGLKIGKRWLFHLVNINNWVLRDRAWEFDVTKPIDFMTTSEAAFVLNVSANTLNHHRLNRINGALGRKGPRFIRLCDHLVRYLRVDLPIENSTVTSDQAVIPQAIQH